MAENAELPKEIKIIVDTATGDITVAPTQAEVRRGQAVHWELFAGNIDRRDRTEGSFLLVFYDGLGEADGEAVGGLEVRGTGKAGATQRVGNKSGFFHYKVIASIADRLYADVGCPSIKIP